MTSEFSQKRAARLKKRKREQRISALLSASIMIACCVLGYVAADYLPKGSQAQLITKDGEVTEIGSISAAGRLCQSQAGVVYGDAHIDSLIDDFSTRYDEPRNLFVVLMISSVYKENGARDYRVHCHVVPKDTVVSYFKGFEVKV